MPYTTMADFQPTRPQLQQTGSGHSFMGASAEARLRRDEREALYRREALEKREAEEKERPLKKIEVTASPSTGSRMKHLQHPETATEEPEPLKPSVSAAQPATALAETREVGSHGSRNVFSKTWKSLKRGTKKLITQKSLANLRGQSQKTSLSSAELSSPVGSSGEPSNPGSSSTAPSVDKAGMTPSVPLAGESAAPWLYEAPTAAQVDTLQRDIISASPAPASSDTVTATSRFPRASPAVAPWLYDARQPDPDPSAEGFAGGALLAVPTAARRNKSMPELKKEARAATARAPPLPPPRDPLPPIPSSRFDMQPGSAMTYSLRSAVPGPPPSGPLPPTPVRDRDEAAGGRGAPGERAR